VARAHPYEGKALHLMPKAGPVSPPG